MVLLRATPGDAERLAEEGADIVLVSLTPKPLRPMAAASFPPVTVADPLVRSMIDQVSQTKLEQYVRDLSGESAAIVGGEIYTIATRHTMSGTPIEKATQYVGERLTGLGLTVENHPWSKTIGTISYSGNNVIGQITGETPLSQIFLIGAHLDDMPVGAIAPGADDNASGSAAALVAADILSQYRWGCTLRFALWTGEEQGLLGSAAYAQRSRNQSENIAGVLNLDMIAWNTLGSSPDIDLHAKSTLPATVDLANQFKSVITAYGLNLVPQVITNGTGASDHASFWNQSYSAILGIEDYYPNRPDFNPYYHQPTDTLDKFDMDYFADFVKASVGDFVHMSNCLLTGALDGNVTANHDNSAVVGATIAMTDTHDLSYSANTNGSGDYDRTLPAATYDITASAYGYLPASVRNVPLTTGGLTQDFVLQDAPPVAPQVTTQMSFGAGDAVQLTWSHVAPNMGYAAYRGEGPIFRTRARRPARELGNALPHPDHIR